MHNIFLLLGGLSAALGVALGAFGAHALRNRLTPERLQTFNTANHYQMYHALALILTAVLVTGGIPGRPLLIAAGWFFCAGTLLFSGSLYLLVLSGKRWWGMVAPLGGLAFILGWVCLTSAWV
ncbi:MAG TPA: DUF423 domain-containing protein [Anaerolineales bacterium]|nr:DUF423 domain-containing protein [Anaerolineales bacterium]